MLVFSNKASEGGNSSRLRVLRVDLSSAVGPAHPHITDILGARFIRREVPCVDGSRLARAFFTPTGWSVRPCVRPVCAVHMTAGQNALRGSGPGQKPAFKDAMALVGCLTAGSTGSALRAVRPPNLHITPDTRRDLATASARPGNCTAHPWPSVPRPFEQAYWQAR
jgi:hypothetical protein